MEIKVCPCCGREVSELLEEEKERNHQFESSKVLRCVDCVDHIGDEENCPFRE